MDYSQCRLISEGNKLNLFHSIAKIELNYVLCRQHDLVGDQSYEEMNPVSANEIDFLR